MSGDSDQNRLEKLNMRIKKARDASDQTAKVLDDSKVAQSRHAVKVIRVGSDFVAVVVLFGGAGWYLDRLLDTTPWLMLVMITVGFITGFWMLVRLLINSKKPARQDKE